MERDRLAGDDSETALGVLVDCGACPYLPDRRFHAFHILDQGERADPVERGIRYRRLLDLGFRRSGEHVYRPMCAGCSECRPLRVDVAAFAPRRDQRRCRRRNADCSWSWQPRGFDAERSELFTRYQLQIHADEVESDPGFFLVRDGGIPGGEVHVRDGDGRLLAVSICDLIGDALSSVYCYYDPDHPRRSLGTFAALCEIAFAAERGLRWWYLGFHVADCRKMRYKARFGPHQILDADGWRCGAPSPAPSTDEDAAW